MSISSYESISSFCGPSSTSYYNATQHFSKAFYAFACDINSIISISSTLGNILVLSAIRKCQSLHSPSKALLFSLAMTDLFVGIVVLPLFIAYHLTIILEMLNYYCVIAVSYTTTSKFVSSISLLTVVTISVERYIAFRLRLRYRAVVTFQPLVCYFAIRRGIRGHVIQIRQQQNHGRTTIVNNIDLPHYRKTLRNMMWISGLLIACYMPFLLALFAMSILGRTDSTRFAVNFSGIALYLNSSLNPILYCWRIKDLRDRVMENCSRICNCLFRLNRSLTQNEITGNTTVLNLQRPGPGNEDI
ncbi:Beta-2 adrenergic receptor [Acropora cervicornis]|uniref:Beta-2 adrenergic receptor n=1 Tax=Acropora cervicornis TaxID=6130 RepID=A0AAD9VG41_ACRCE|nr:Beta-2 adrenergic receptor [Acropora cervicornis]